MSTTTAGYALFAMAKPRHLGTALTNSPLRRPEYEVVARLFGPRDLAISAMALFAASAQVPEQSMVAGVALDLDDAALHSREAKHTTGRPKVLVAAIRAERSIWTADSGTSPAGVPTIRASRHRSCSCSCTTSRARRRRWAFS